MGEVVSRNENEALQCAKPAAQRYIFAEVVDYC